MCIIISMKNVILYIINFFIKYNSSKPNTNFGYRPREVSY